jgi:3-methyladenine DNA glycosylase/8-oxoguanine DNA glycosylase
MARTGIWHGAVPGNRAATAWQRADGRVVVQAPDEEALATARFMLALDDDTGVFHERFGRDPLIGASARAFVGYRPLRLATVTHAVVRALCGQLIEARRARAIERAIAGACGETVVTQPALRRFAPVELRRLGLAQHRATVLARLAATVDLERLRDLPGDDVAARLSRERGIGPWSIGLISTEGLGRFDRGLVGDLSLVKLHAALTGRWVEGHETAELLAPYGDWQGLAGEILLLGWSRGLVRGASADRARISRRRERRAA